MQQKHKILRKGSYSPQSRTQRIAATGKPDTSEEFTIPQIASRETNGVKDFHVNTIANWIHKGARGRKMESNLRGGNRTVTKAQFQKFYFGEAA